MSDKRKLTCGSSPSTRKLHHNKALVTQVQSHNSQHTQLLFNCLIFCAYHRLTAESCNAKALEIDIAGIF